MLTSDTKKKIDAARDILVGKIPMPTTQVEQITLALIYKFMGDMDKRARAMGDETGFFSNGYEQYAWDRLMDKSLSARDRVKVYSEGLEKMSTNPHLPQLFRDIFRNAYLPFNSPETLKLFLDQIDQFSYDHSEELGNAFEYLLSSMGSQGDAGQFRTPRHIIDFIVDVVDPQVGDRILDPACGTAGFLISAFKHMQKKGLRADELLKITENVVGYDISYDMVRLSLVNLYLHHFSSPHIYEYDSLSSEDRWDDQFDCILANPPFMSPKGGIKPHGRFSIPSSRSEVLFVDYIMEHLSQHGKAGVIVPEGVIFQSQGAHTKLRKMMVEEMFLWAVVSLPAGVFNPYAGVKTSILFFDRDIASKSDSVLFYKVNSDGFELGAQRKASTKNDLPEAAEILKKWKSGEKKESPNVLHVKKSEIGRNKEFNLSGERYRTIVDAGKSSWPLVCLEDVSEINPKKAEVKSLPSDTYVSFIPMADLTEEQMYVIPQQKKRIGEALTGYTYFRNKDILIARVSPCFENKKVSIALNLMNEIGFGSSEYIVIRSGPKILPEFLYFMINTDDFRNNGIAQMTGTGGLQRVPPDYVRNCAIPLPPLEKQKQIVKELDGYSAIISGAKQIVQNWKPNILIDASWRRVPVSEIAKLEYGIGETAKESGEFRYVRITDIGENGELKGLDKRFISETKESTKYLLTKGDVLVARTGATFGKTVYFDSDEKSAFAGFLIRFNFDTTQILSKYFWCFAQSDEYWRQAKSLVTGGGQPQFNANAVSQIIVPLPTIEVQKKLIEKIEAERALVVSAKKLIEIYEAKIKEKIDEVWGKAKA